MTKELKVYTTVLVPMRVQHRRKWSDTDEIASAVEGASAEAMQLAKAGAEALRAAMAYEGTAACVMRHDPYVEKVEIVLEDE